MNDVIKQAQLASAPDIALNNQAAEGAGRHINRAAEGAGRHKQNTLHEIGNVLAQSGRILGGAVQGAAKSVFAPGLLKNALDRQHAKKIQSKTGDPDILMETGQGFTDTFNAINSGMENWTNSWVPPPQTPVANVAAKVADVVGEAIPAFAVSALTGGSSAVTGGGATTMQIMAGNALSHATGAAAAVSTELAEGSGDPGRAMLRGATSWASEAIGGATLDKISGKIASPFLSGTVSSISEGIEENIDGVLYSTISGDTYTLKDAVSDFAYGAAAGLALNGLANIGNPSKLLAKVTQGGQISTDEIVHGRNHTGEKAGGESHGSAPSIGSKSTGITSTETIDSYSVEVPYAGRTGGTDNTAPHISGNMSPVISDGALPSIGIQVQGSTTELGNTEIQGNAVPSTPDTEPWKFPDLEPNTIPFPTQPDPDTNPLPDTDPQIIPFPAPDDPVPNTIPFPAPAQPDPDIPATDPKIIPFPSPSQPDPDADPTIQPLETPGVDPEPNTIPFPTPAQPEPSVSPDANPETQPDAQPESTPDAMPDAQPQTTPERQPQPAPQTQPEVSPDAVPDAQPETRPDTQPQPAPGINPAIEPQTVPDDVPDSASDPDPVTSVQADPAAHPQTNPQQQTALQEDAQAQTSAQIWTAVQYQSDTAPQWRDEKRRYSGTDNLIYNGRGAHGRIYESTGYAATFGGLSSY